MRKLDLENEEEEDSNDVNLKSIITELKKLEVHKEEESKESQVSKELAETQKVVKEEEKKESKTNQSEKKIVYNIRPETTTDLFVNPRETTFKKIPIKRFHPTTFKISFQRESETFINATKRRLAEDRKRSLFGLINFIIKILSVIFYTFTTFITVGIKMSYLVFTWSLILFFYESYNSNVYHSTQLSKQIQYVDLVLKHIKKEKTLSLSYYATLAIIEQKSTQPLSREEFIQIYTLKEILESSSYTEIEKAKIKTYVIKNRLYKEILSHNIKKLTYLDSNYIFLKGLVLAIIISYHNKRFKDERLNFFYEFYKILTIDVFYKLDRDFMFYNLKDYMQPKDSKIRLSDQVLKEGLLEYQRTTYDLHHNNRRVSLQYLYDSYLKRPSFKKRDVRNDLKNILN